MVKKTFINNIKSMESGISMFLGVVVVMVVGVLLFNFFRSNKPNSINMLEQESGEKTTGSETETGEKAEGVLPLPQGYTVRAGDNLWKISVKFYGYGYNWVDISKENNLLNPNHLIVGQELNIPDVPVRKPIIYNNQSLSVEQPGPTPITGDSYTVVKDDNLWNVSVRAYQDGFKWPMLAEANKLVDPNIIHPGNVLTIPR